MLKSNRQLPLILLLSVMLVGAATWTANAEDEVIIQGTVIFVSIADGAIEVQEASGKTYTLKAGEDMKITELKEGQTFIFKCNRDLVIQSVVRKG